MQYLNIVDNTILYAMTPAEYNRKMKGAMLQEVKRYEDMSIQAIFNARAANGKRMSPKKLFDAEKARQNILRPKEQREKERANRDYSNLRAALKALNNKDKST